MLNSTLLKVLKSQWLKLSNSQKRYYRNQNNYCDENLSLAKNIASSVIEYSKSIADNSKPTKKSK